MVKSNAWKGKTAAIGRLLNSPLRLSQRRAKLRIKKKWQPSAAEIQSPRRHNCNLQLAPSRLDFSQDVFEILNQTGRGEIERVTFR